MTVRAIEATAAVEAARTRLDALNERRTEALETCRPHPHPTTIREAEAELAATEDQLKAASIVSEGARA